VQSVAMICRTCRGTGKSNDHKFCLDCLGTGHAVEREKPAPQETIVALKDKSDGVDLEDMWGRTAGMWGRLHGG